MTVDSIFSALDISASGMRAERFRMEVIANNIANAQTTQTPEGGPYRRQVVLFASALPSPAALADTSRGHTGVRVEGVALDPAELPRVHMPGHPHADSEGWVTMPNVRVPFEMVDLITASRAYEANLRALQALQQMAEQSLALLRGSSV